MKRLFKTVIVLCVVFALSMSLLVLPTSAAGNTTLSFSKKEVTVGDTVTVSVKLSVPDMYSAEVNISYNENVLTYVSGASSGGGGVASIVEDLSGESSKTFVLTFKAAKAGSCNISANGAVGVQQTEDELATDIVLSGASASMTVKDVSLSANANLKSLTVSSGSLSPRFSQSVTNYKVNVKKNVTQCKIYVTTADPDAKVSVSGSSTLKIGKNKRVVTVTAPSGKQKSYNVVINRSNVDEDTSSKITDEPNPLETIIGGITYTVASDISKIDIPAGFRVSQKLYNKEKVAVASDNDKNFELYYLKSATGDKYVPYTYDETANSFEKVKIIEQGQNQYIIAEIPEGFSVSSELYATNMTLEDEDINCYAVNDEKLSDMYYFYCFNNGKFGMYRYDTVEKVLQRSPEYELVSNDEDLSTATDASGGIFERYKGLSKNSKTIVVCLLIAAIGFIALIVLLIVRFANGHKSNDFDLDQDDDFDSISLGENFEILSDDDEDK